jgi:hypothetical protein
VGAIPSANDQVHAAGALDVDVRFDVATRSRATAGYAVYAVQHHSRNSSN